MKPIVVAGNGPSLAQIDYSLLPEDFDVFRCNQFYFEDRYFLGKKIKGVFFNPFVFKEQFFTLHHLKKRGEYEVEDVYCNIVMGAWDRRNGRGEKLDLQEDLEYDFPSAKSVYPYLKKMQDFNALHKFYALYYEQRFTSGVIALITALAQGYKEIYLTGIDFYEDGGVSYAFNVQGDKEINKKLPMFNQNDFRDKVHYQNVDLEAIKLALSLDDIHLYAISPNSALSKILPYPKNKNSNPMQAVLKPKDYICDFIPLPQIESAPPPHRKQTLVAKKLQEVGISKNNLYVRLSLDFFKLLKGVFKILKR